MLKLVIGIPCRNEATYIEDTLRSCIDQIRDREDCAIVISDCCSSDASEEIIRNTVASYPITERTKVKIITHNADIGGKANWASTFYALDSKYFIWVGAHDLLEGNFIGKAIEVLDKNIDISAVSGGHKAIDSCGKPLDIEVPKYNFDQNSKVHRYIDVIRTFTNGYILHSVFRKDALDGYDMLHEDAPSADHIMFARMLWFGKLWVNNDAYFVRRYFSRENRQEKIDRDDYVTSTNNHKFLDSHLRDLRKLMANETESSPSGSIIETIVQLELVKRFGLPFIG